jgi:hypothetical protein
VPPRPPKPNPSIPPPNRFPAWSSSARKQSNKILAIALLDLKFNVRMKFENDLILDASILTEGLFEDDAIDVILDFGGQSVSGFRKKLEETWSTMDLMFTFSVVNKKGFQHFFPAIDDYARSVDSELNCEFPSSIAHAIANQIGINPAAVTSMSEEVKLLLAYLSDNLAKYKQQEEWRSSTAEELIQILDRLQTSEVGSNS